MFIQMELTLKLYNNRKGLCIEKPLDGIALQAEWEGFLILQAGSLL